MFKSFTILLFIFHNSSDHHEVGIGQQDGFILKPKQSESLPMEENLPVQQETLSNEQTDFSPEEQKELEEFLIEKPNFGLSGLLAQDVQAKNLYKGIQMKWTEPPDAVTPAKGWLLFAHQGEEVLNQGKPYSLHRQSAYLFGKNREIADIELEKVPSCSEQHAVIQFRRVAIKVLDKDGNPQRTFDSFQNVVDKTKFVVRPYLLSIEATNNTKVNGKLVPSARYYELRDNDVIQFGQSLRDYVLKYSNLSGVNKK